ncbi:MAG: hypothetical protein KME32_08270 [Mojavia pulchra JT2-VF2]|uniref:Uncharacterized protein n=1 Tax=Mojavia pulchra JT2-VF2 TaxID=287848 RepID=A0A951PVN9_9NOST|nr:hypothetical protein [Mojavia pulchra JT2-VF2]
MLRSKKQMSKQGGCNYRMLQTKAIKVTAPFLVIAGWLATMVPSLAVTASYSNDYRVCAAQLLRVNITPVAASQACATALRPREVSACAANINKQTQISAASALATCTQARRPEELATCVVGIGRNVKEAVNPELLNYCGRSLLPVRFAQCVVGLRSEINIALTQVLDTCIDGSDRISSFAPSSTPLIQNPAELRPLFETTPIPSQPGNQ